MEPGPRKQRAWPQAASVASGSSDCGALLVAVGRERPPRGLGPPRAPRLPPEPASGAAACVARRSDPGRVKLPVSRSDRFGDMRLGLEVITVVADHC